MSCSVVGGQNWREALGEVALIGLGQLPHNDLGDGHQHPMLPAAGGMRASEAIWAVPSTQPLQTTTKDLGLWKRFSSPLLSGTCQEIKSINSVITTDTFSYFISDKYGKLDT